MILDTQLSQKHLMTVENKNSMFWLKHFLKPVNIVMYCRRSTIQMFKQNSKQFVISRIRYIDPFYKRVYQAKGNKL